MSNRIKDAYVDSYPDIYVKKRKDNEYESFWLVALGLHETLRINGKELINFEEVMKDARKA